MSMLIFRCHREGVIEEGSSKSHCKRRVRENDVQSEADADYSGASDSDEEGEGLNRRFPCLEEESAADVPGEAVKGTGAKQPSHQTPSTFPTRSVTVTTSSSATLRPATQMATATPSFDQSFARWVPLKRSAALPATATRDRNTSVQNANEELEKEESPRAGEYIEQKEVTITVENCAGEAKKESVGVAEMENQAITVVKKDEEDTVEKSLEKMQVDATLELESDESDGEGELRIHDEEEEDHGAVKEDRVSRVSVLRYCSLGDGFFQKVTVCSLGYGIISWVSVLYARYSYRFFNNMPLNFQSGKLNFRKSRENIRVIQENNCVII